jgi:hypothetical protein
MSVTFGWWHRDPVEGKFQIHVDVHGGNIEWTRHQGHNTSWLPHHPTDEDRERLGPDEVVRAVDANAHAQ